MAFDDQGMYAMVGEAERGREAYGPPRMIRMGTCDLEEMVGGISM